MAPGEGQVQTAPSPGLGAAQPSCEAWDHAAGPQLVLGPARMIPGFEEGLVGAKAGEERVLNLTFPEDYQNLDLAGKAAEFTVTVNSVSEPKLP
ncbi:FKBP-type peptidyl-prolyl cis-trans isomerase, partial [Shigella flexneri]|nr:FKBP-type peptidyl-prolyl cis-trans isomerase [Shigella flexneri]